MLCPVGDSIFSVEGVATNVQASASDICYVLRFQDIKQEVKASKHSGWLAAAKKRRRLWIF
jgi:hypothetical protein